MPPATPGQQGRPEPEHQAREGGRHPAPSHRAGQTANPPVQPQPPHRQMGHRRAAEPPACTSIRRIRAARSHRSAARGRIYAGAAEAAADLQHRSPHHHLRWESGSRRRRPPGGFARRRAPATARGMEGMGERRCRRWGFRPCRP
ncbi:hypothetical protein ACQJBY_071643 [Aegilops geniculata]